METPKEYYYTYYSYEEYGRGYIGSRKCYCLPEEDIKYFGSSKDKTFKPTQKIILKSDYATREEAYADEIILQEYYKVVENPHFANRAYQTSTKFSYIGTKEEYIKKGKKSSKKNKDNKVGIFALTNEELRENGKKGGAIAGQKTYELGVGLFSQTEEQLLENCSNGGKIAYKLGLGVHGRSKEEMIEHGKKGAKRAKELNVGIFAISEEQRRENGKKTGHQRWQCTETGFISNAGNLTKYQRKRGIDTSKRIRLE